MEGKSEIVASREKPLIIFSLMTYNHEVDKEGLEVDCVCCRG